VVTSATTGSYPEPVETIHAVAHSLLQISPILYVRPSRFS